MRCIKRSYFYRVELTDVFSKTRMLVQKNHLLVDLPGWKGHTDPLMSGHENYSSVRTGICLCCTTKLICDEVTTIDSDIWYVTTLTDYYFITPICYPLGTTKTSSFPTPSNGVHFVFPWCLEAVRFVKELYQHFTHYLRLFKTAAWMTLLDWPNLYSPLSRVNLNWV